ncbi:MAG: flagellar biosynthetic protein FliR [Oscillospiraceae bacterium]|nr:flagellar biosynthetic protein FliR [Oscillospiraceae bacterium]
MFDWSRFTLFLYVVMRMSGFVLFNPILARNGFPNLYKAGFILATSVAVYAADGGTVPVPSSLLIFMLRLMLELGLGLSVALIMRFFFYIPDQGGNEIDTQMGLTMARTYDAGSQAQMTVTGNLLNAMMLLLFFEANGHNTLMRLMMTSGEIVPFGSVSFHSGIPELVVELFVECALLSVKLCLPILVAELLGQVGMGVLMKVIPQINVFAINIEFKVIVGLSMLYIMIAPISEFLLDVELQMLSGIRQLLIQVG